MITRKRNNVHGIVSTSDDIEREKEPKHIVKIRENKIAIFRLKNANLICKLESKNFVKTCKV